MLSDKKLEKILIEVSKTTNPFSINDICLYFGLPRNVGGRETLDLEYGINGYVVARFVKKSDNFKRFETKSNSHALWEYLKNDMERQKNQKDGGEQINNPVQS